MSDKTGIEWTDASWNPVRGCSMVSAGCTNCYAMAVANRFKGAGQPYEGLITSTSQGPKWSGKITLVDDMLDQPLRWRSPRRIFVNSMSDLFHDGVPDSFIDQVFAVMAHCSQHTFQILTKRPERMRDYLANPELQGRITDLWRAMGKDRDTWSVILPLSNVWLGVSVENQPTADERIPLLLQTPAAVRWVSGEPLLGPVDIARWLDPTGIRCHDVCADSRYLQLSNGEVATSDPICPRCGSSDADWTGYDPGIDWVVVGGESGPGARPMHPDWARSLRDQCALARVPFFFKQWGEWLSGFDYTPELSRIDGGVDSRYPCALWRDGAWDIGGHSYLDIHHTENPLYRVGKKAAGRLLDGCELNQFPGEVMP